MLFDDCAFGAPPQTQPSLAKQRDPLTGMILPSWTRWTGSGSRKDRLHYAQQAGATATWETKGSSVALLHKVGPDCGLALALIAGQPASKAKPVVLLGGRPGRRTNSWV